MSTLAFLIVGVFLLVFQTTTLQMVPGWLGYPDLVFILVAFVAYRFDLLRGLFLAFSCGWMMDVAIGSYPGIYLFEYLLVFLCLHFLTINSPVKESAYQVPLVGISYSVAQFLLYTIMTMIVSEPLSPWSWSRLIRETLILTVATIPCFILLNSFYEYLQKRRTVSRLSRKKAGNRFR